MRKLLVHDSTMVITWDPTVHGSSIPFSQAMYTPTMENIQGSKVYEVIIYSCMYMDQDAHKVLFVSAVSSE